MLRSARLALIGLAGAGIIAGILYWQRGAVTQRAFTPTDTTPQATAQLAEADIEVVAADLAIPWEIAFLPNKELLVTERPGRLVKISQEKTIIPIEGVQHIGEGGLLGLALHPEFTQNNFLYLYLTTTAGEALVNRVERYRLAGNQLLDKQIIIENIPGARFHDGGRIAFSPAELAGGPPYYLYITTGDAGQEELAQDTASLAGKILRVHDDGRIPADNPFNNAVYSYGHRNVQGLAWDSGSNLWATEHGRSGIQSGYDEINRIERGKNYGWPQVEGDQTREGLTPPAAHSGPRDTWAPAGAIMVGDSLFFAGLRGEALYEARREGIEITGVASHLSGRFGRLRAVQLGPDGFIYLSTSNTDGRGDVRPGDDKIIKIDPGALKK